MAKETFSRNKPDTQPPPPPPAGFISIDITNAAGVLTELNLLFADQPDSRFYATIYATMWMGTGVMSPKKSAFKLIAAEQIPSTPFILNVKDKYLARLGQPELGNKIFVKVIVVDSVSGKLFPQGQLPGIVSGT